MDGSSSGDATTGKIERKVTREALGAVELKPQQNIDGNMGSYSGSGQQMRDTRQDARRRQALGGYMDGSSSGDATTGKVERKVTREALQNIDGNIGSYSGSGQRRRDTGQKERKAHEAQRSMEGEQRERKTVPGWFTTMGFLSMGATDSSKMDEQLWLESRGHEREEKENNDESPEEIHGEIVRGREEDETEEEQSGSLWMADLGWIRGTGEEKTILQSETPELFNDSVLIE